MLPECSFRHRLQVRVTADAAVFNLNCGYRERRVTATYTALCHKYTDILINLIILNSLKNCKLN